MSDHSNASGSVATGGGAPGGVAHSSSPSIDRLSGSSGGTGGGRYFGAVGSRAERQWAIGLAVLAIGSFVLALLNAPIGDDRLIVVKRLGDVSLGSLFRLFIESYWGGLHAGGLYRPVALFLLGLQKLFFGAELTGFHAVSLLLHAGCSVLVFRLLRRWTGLRGAAFVGAALFACHPIHAEAVATVYGQADLWAALFGLAALDRYTSWVIRPTSPKRWIWVYVLYLLALGSKESVVMLPAAAVLIRGLYGRVDTTGWRRWVGRREAWFAAPLAVYLIARLAVLGVAAVPTAASTVAWGYPLWARANLIIVTLGTYLRLLVIPRGQTIYYGHLRDAIFGFPLLELAWLLGAMFGLRALTRVLDRRLMLLTAGWLVLMILPVANALPIGVVVAERCLYLPSVAVAILATAVFSRFHHGRARRSRIRARWASGVVVVVLAISVVQSARVSWRWRTPVHLWWATVNDHPTSPKAFAALGLAVLEEMVENGEVLYASNPRWVTAQSSIDKAITLNDRSPDAWHGKGLMAMAREDYAGALPHLEKAHNLRPHDSEISDHLRLCREALSR